MLGPLAGAAPVPGRRAAAFVPAAPGGTSGPLCGAGRGAGRRGGRGGRVDQEALFVCGSVRR